MPTADGHRYLPSTAVFLVEVLKLAICLTISLYEISLSRSPIPCLQRHSSVYWPARFLAADSWKMASSCHSVHLGKQFTICGHIEPRCSNVPCHISVSRFFVTAHFSASLLLRRTISGRQWLSLLLLMLGVAIVSFPAQLFGVL